MHGPEALNYATRACSAIAGLQPDDAILGIVPLDSAPGFTFTAHLRCPLGIRWCWSTHGCPPKRCGGPNAMAARSGEQQSELQSLMRNSYAGFCLKKKKQNKTKNKQHKNINK